MLMIPDEDSIYNGADDNASGTTGILLSAEAIANAPSKPKRSIVFVGFSGEEKGCLVPKLLRTIHRVQSRIV